MSVTYLIMQYSVQYIIAPVIFLMGQRKTEGLASLSMKKAKVEFTLNFLCDFLSVLFSSGDWALVSMQLSSPDATFWSDMDIQHATAKLYMPFSLFPPLRILTWSLVWVDGEMTIMYLQYSVGFMADCLVWVPGGEE